MSLSDSGNKNFAVPRRTDNIVVTIISFMDSISINLFLINDGKNIIFFLFLFDLLSVLTLALRAETMGNIFGK